MGEKRRHKKGGEKEGERMMGQVWNLHTLLVASTIGMFALP